MIRQPAIDFAALADKARGMTDAALHYALLDIQKTLPAADAMDRTEGGDRGGRYRDEASVYRAEVKARRLAPAIAAGRVPGATDKQIRDAEDRVYRNG